MASQKPAVLLDVQSAWQAYEYQSSLLVNEQIRVKAYLLGKVPTHFFQRPMPPLHPRYFGQTEEELDTLFSDQQQIIEHQAMFTLLATTEAALRLDFRYWVKTKQRDAVSREFRRLYNQQGKKISLDTHILETWKEYAPHTKPAVGNFRSALRLRHWLAHGQHWTPKLGRDYTPIDVFDIATNLLNATVTLPAAP